VSRIRDGVGVVGGGWFAENVVRRVGNGVETLFWTDPWLGGVSLSVRYRRLFDLAINKSISVATMCELGWEEGGVTLAPTVVGVGGGDARGVHRFTR
jgi:hypothetical protein